MLFTVLEVLIADNFPGERKLTAGLILSGVAAAAWLRGTAPISLACGWPPKSGATLVCGAGFVAPKAESLQPAHAQIFESGALCIIAKHISVV